MKKSMIGDGDETPSRYELLSMVMKHSKLLGKTVVDGQDESDVEMDQGFWHDVLNLYFICGRESRGRHDDDLIFFVRKMNPNGQSYSDDGERDPYFVRRWALKLESVVGEKITEVDWRRSFYLNLIAHTSFTVTVAICSNEVLKKHRVAEDTPLTPIYKVVKTVYASPSRVNFHLDAKKEVETVPAYPDICFAIDDFDCTFDALVLSDYDHCFCVVLDAHDGAAFPCERPVHDPTSNSFSLQAGKDTKKTCASKVTIFSGFVSYQMVRDAFDAGRHRFGSLLSFSHSSGKTDRLYMQGPGGRGEVELAVSGVEDQSLQFSGPPSPVVSKRGFGIGTIFDKAASVASVAKHAYAAASRNPDDMLPLKCCLMSISLPWEHIASDLLFKGSPSVNL